jgi:hypothetical protein
MASLWRDELHARYSIGQRIARYQRHIEVSERKAFASLVERIGADRTTLSRYAFVSKRIHPPEFEALVALGDARGYPASFWDFVEIASRAQPERYRLLQEHLAVRTPATTQRLRISEALRAVTPPRR